MDGELKCAAVVAGETKAGVDPRLRAETRGRLLTLFDYHSYRLLRTDEADTPCGQAVAFNLPAGRILHVCPLATHGNLVALELVLFAGARAVMRTQLKIMKGGMLVLVGSQSLQAAYITSLTIESAGTVPGTGGIGTASAVPSPIPSGRK